MTLWLSPRWTDTGMRKYISILEQGQLTSKMAYPSSMKSGACSANQFSTQILIESRLCRVNGIWCFSGSPAGEAPRLEPTLPKQLQLRRPDSRRFRWRRVNIWGRITVKT